MDATQIAALIGLGQLVVAVLIWFGVTPSNVGKWLTLPTIAGNKLILILLTGGLAFSSYAFYRTLMLPLTHTELLGRSLIFAWGTDGPLCKAGVNLAPLWKLRDKYGVAIACGLDDGTVDRSEDKRITISALFNIQNGALMMNAPYRPAMAQAVQKQIEEERKQRNLGSDAYVTTKTWYELIVLPKSTDPSNIHQLSDVRRYGGRVITQEPLRTIE